MKDIKMTKVEKTIEILKQNPKGISTENLGKSLGIKTASVYGLINKAKKNNIDIVSINRLYFYNQPRSVVVNNDPQPKPNKKPFVDKSILKEVANLSTSDQNDFFDMMQKSVFYRISAEAIVRSKQVVDEMKLNLGVL